MAWRVSGRKLLSGALAALVTVVGACTEPDVRRPGLLAVTSGEAQEAEVGTALPALVEVQVTDTGGRTVPRVVVNFRVSPPAGAGFTSGSVSPASAETDGGGVARVRWTLGTGAGVHTLHVWIGPSEEAAISKVELHATARPGVAASIVRVTPPVVAITVGDSALAQVAAADRYGNPTTLGSISWQSLDPAVARVSRIDGGAVVVGQAHGVTTLEAHNAVAGTARFDVRAYVGPGRQIAFNSLGRILLLSADGATTTVLRENASDPAWSPNGQRIAFTGRVGTNDAVYVMNADGSGAVALTDTSAIGGARHPSWSPDGQRIAFIAVAIDPSGSRGLPSVYVMNADGSARTVVAFGSCPGIGNCTGAQRPAWSPDGTRIAFTSRKTACFAGVYGQLFVVSPDASGLQHIAGVPGRGAFLASEPAWSPDSRRILFQGQDVVPTPNSTGCHAISAIHLFHFINLDGTGLARLTSLSPVAATISPTWSPDSRIAFAGAASFGPGLFVMNADGTEARRVASPPGAVSRPAWRPMP
jgi:Tol biopolymer transport system component